MPPPKKSRTGLFIGLGCGGLFLLVLLVGGILLYLEEGKGLHVPDTEVATAPILPDGRFSIEYTWDGTGWAFNNLWLVVEEGAKSGGETRFRVSVTCGSSSGSERTETRTLGAYGTHDFHDKGGGAFSAWVYMEDDYNRGSSMKRRCSGRVVTEGGSLTRAHIAVTQRQRPSDYFAF